MAGVELIVAALAAGGAAGLSGAATTAVGDAYSELKKRLANVIRSRDARRALEQDSAEREFWSRAIGPDLESSGLGDDEAVIRDAQRLLVLTGNAPAATTHGSGDALSGGQPIKIDTNYGAVGTFNGPVHLAGPSADPR
jgi:hypothetical protein